MSMPTATTTATAMTSPAESSPELTFSFAYRQRIPITSLCVVAGVCGTLLTVPFVREATPLDHLCDGIGWAMLGVAILVRLWSSGHISGRKSKTLVFSGPYAACRNPQYIGTLLIAISQMLFLKSCPFALACIIPIMLYALAVVPAEERLLRQRFGTAYADYCQRVPRWSPLGWATLCWPSRWSSQSLQWGRPENPTAFRRECIRCVWWCLLPLVSELISALREMISPIV
ncbi:MAG: methyltransferase family protein [Planctomycetaceae bacterium]